jgi:hypothetical protein
MALTILRLRMPARLCADMINQVQDADPQQSVARQNIDLPSNQED